MDIATGFPGLIHDARMLRASTLFTQAEREEIMVSPLENIQGTNIRPLIIGDGAYPNTSRMVKPYPHNIILDHSQRKFNRTLSSTRSLVERSFGLLKARFQCLLKRLDNELENITTAIISCCVLHNICQMTGEELLDEEILDQIIADMCNQ